MDACAVRERRTASIWDEPRRRGRGDGHTRLRRRRGAPVPTRCPDTAGPLPREGERFYQLAVTAYYRQPGELASVAVDALRGPQVSFDGMSFIGQVPSKLEDRFYEYAEARGTKVNITSEGEPASQELGLLIRAQRAGDILLTRAFFTAKFDDWANTLSDSARVTSGKSADALLLATVWTTQSAVEVVALEDGLADVDRGPAHLTPRAEHLHGDPSAEDHGGQDDELSDQRGECGDERGQQQQSPQTARNPTPPRATFTAAREMAGLAETGSGWVGLMA